jgi:hypothetical protein
MARGTILIFFNKVLNMVNKNNIFTMEDGFQWEIKTTEEARELFHNNEELYIVNKLEQTERGVHTKEDLEDINQQEEFYAIEFY